MRKLAPVPLLLFGLLATVAAAAQSLPPAVQNNPDVPKNLKPYFVGLLIEPEQKLPALSPEEQQRLFQQHVAYIRSQVEAGKYAVAGPLLDNGRIGGLVIINAVSAEEAKKLLNNDPLVKAGRFASEVHPAMFADLSGVHAQYAPAK